MPIPTAEDRLGNLFAGRYTLESILGTGGTGVVYTATHFWTSRKVAVKLLRAHLASDLSSVRRFVQEARSASDVPHPNVVQVFDVGAEDDGTVFLVMELLKGESLGALITREETLTLEDTVALLVPIMDALVLAHDRGIVHRDLKPENIVLHHDPRGRVTPKLLDFGMSKILDPAWGQATQTGTIVGTPYYMAPEQAEGDKDQGPPCDVWSMGVVFYRCLSGRLPFEADSPTALLLRIVRDRPTPLSELAPQLPEAIASVVDRALLADRSARWPDMGSFLDALGAACADAGVPVPPVSREPLAPRAAFDPGPRRSARGNRRWLAAGAALLALGLAAGMWWSASRSEPVAQAQAPTDRSHATASAPPTVSTHHAPSPASEPTTEVSAGAPSSEASAPPPSDASGPRRGGRDQATVPDRRSGALPPVTRRW